MTARTLAAMLSAAMVLLPLGSAPARADNPMGYRLLTQEEAASLPHNRGALGLDIERSQRIDDDGLSFDIMRVKQVRRDTAGANAGFKDGDQIIAVDGRVFQSLATFAAYVGSIHPGDRIHVDYMPASGGPQQAQRLEATVGTAGQPMSAPAGMSTGTKVAIGVGAVALFRCYELGCFKHRQAGPQPNRQQMHTPTPNVQQ